MKIVTSPLFPGKSLTWLGEHGSMWVCWNLMGRLAQTVEVSWCVTGPATSARTVGLQVVAPNTRKASNRGVRKALFKMLKETCGMDGRPSETAILSKAVATIRVYHAQAVNNNAPAVGFRP